MAKGFLSETGDDFRYISAVYKSLGESADKGLRVAAASEWLLDNFYIIERQYRDIRSSFTRSIAKKLPGEGGVDMRIYRFAQGLIDKSCGKIDEDYMILATQKEQEERPFTTEEIWALPVMLKVAIFSKLRQVCERIAASQNAYKIAEEIYVRLSKGESMEILKKHMNGAKLVDNSFVEYLVYRLKSGGSKNAFILAGIDRMLQEMETSAAKAVEEEYEKQARRQMSMGNHITNLSVISSIDWTRCFEKLSALERILREDPSGIYEKMDFESRDYYRKAAAHIGKMAGKSDMLAARMALEMAQAASNELMRHIGYYLVGEGKRDLMKSLGARGLSMEKKNKVRAYISCAVVLSFAFSLLICNGSITLFLLSLLPISHIVISAIHYVLGHTKMPEMIPKIEIKDLSEYPVLVVVPTLITDQKRAEELLSALESYYLANRNDGIFFALAGDFIDGKQEVLPPDKALSDYICQTIEALNAKYEQEIFFYFGRKRVYAKMQKKWMGWERKRGALLELSKLLVGDTDTSYETITGMPKNIKYVITLDADTRLPIGSAAKLAGAMLHPLSRPVFDDKKKIVLSGYGIMQPRISVDVESANKTFFSRVFAGQGGIDPYSTVVSDIYQDQFGESIFTGKGIFDLEVFNKALWGAFPENSVLSHDLIEGAYIRCGLVGDVELLDGYPARYNSYAGRQHRWIRGDWQLIFWLFSKIRNSEGKKINNPISMLSKWKLFDNLRRSLMPAAQFILIFYAFCMPKGWVYIAVAVVSAFFGVITYLIDGLIQKNYKYVGQKQYATIISGFKGALYQSGLLFAFLSHQAYLSIDAALRTLYRSLISRKNMLQWVTAADAEKTLGNRLFGYIIKMAFAPICGLALIFFVYWKNQSYVQVAAIVGIVWILSPFIAYQVSLPIWRRPKRISDKEQKLLREWARRTYAYFEDFMQEKTGFIPPDNYQEHPRNGAANRTSPTNIGITLLSVLCAYDLGYATKLQLIDYTEKIISTTQKLPKWNGHLYNWYDTKKFDILKPAYISTVDSGNLAGYLMVLSQGLMEASNKEFLSRLLIEGIRDTASIIMDKGTAIDISPLDNLNDSHCEEEWQSVAHQLLGQTEKLYKMSRWGERLKNQLRALIKEAQLTEEEKEENNQKCRELSSIAQKLALDMDFKPLYNENIGLFSIGFHVEEGKLTNSYYDLLASEARQASLVAIAKGDVSAKHWFKMGRSLTVSDGYKGLSSWSGTMFEYFMPRLIIRNIENTLIDETYQFVIGAQMNYGKKRGVPWGVSESGFAAFDMQLNYQYKAFGVPELGYKRGLAEDTVITPYASMLGLMEAPRQAIANLVRLCEIGAKGEYGFYEAIDYTPERQLRGQHYTIVKSYMVHHNGMSLAALSNVLTNNLLQKRFSSHPMIKSAEYLLSERVPQRVNITGSNQKTRPMKKVDFAYESCCRVLEQPRSGLPLVHMLSNSTFATMIDDRGRGYSKNNHIMLTRFGDTQQPQGMFFYLKNITTGEYYSITPEPAGVDCEYKGVFSSHKAEFTCIKEELTTVCEIGVSPEDSVEVRRITLRNTGKTESVIELTSFMEPVLLTQQEDVSHPAFGKLFVRTEFDSANHALLCVRRPRTDKKSELWAFHRMLACDCEVTNISFETDRAKFIGRGRGLKNPVAMDGMHPLSCRVGAPIDPVMSIRGRVVLPPGMQAHISYISGCCYDREEALALCAKYNSDAATTDIFELALTRSRVVNKYINIKAEEEEFIFELLAHMVYMSPLRRRERKIIENSRCGQKKLWEFGVSGDLPILLCIAEKAEDKDMLERLLKAHEYWRLRGFACDLVVICNEEDGGYLRPVEQRLREIISCSHAREIENRPGGVYLINQATAGVEGMSAFISAARLTVREDVLKSIIPTARAEKKSSRKTIRKAKEYPDLQLPHQEKEFYNGIGGFSQDGKEYIIDLSPDNLPPLPWVNVIANERFGFIVSERGGGYIYSGNSRENRLTPWSNDFVTDPSGEKIYLFDLEDSYLENISSNTRARVRHGFGYSSFEGHVHGLHYLHTQFVPQNDNVKLTMVSLTNMGETPRNMRVVYYLMPMIGGVEHSNLPYINTAFENNVMMGKNEVGQNEYGETMFIATSQDIAMHSGNNHDFDPQGTFETEGRLSGETGGGLAACLAIAMDIKLLAGQTKEFVLLAGTGKAFAEIEDIKEKYTDFNTCTAALASTKAYWNDLLEIITISTPDKSFDFMLNGWLIYQTYACRIHARSGFYQSGGAFGFRDQLQDSCALLYALPKVAKNQIIMCCSRQFEEGDVMHWWHCDPAEDGTRPGKGVRTRFSDDLVWLLSVTAEYIKKTEDYDLLSIKVPYIRDGLLGEDEDEKYISPQYSEIKETVYQHCIRAIDKALCYGEHGLPLMGSGDWNDGMNAVGIKGKGESIWLGFFIYATLKEFIPLCDRMQDTKKAQKYREHLKKIEEAIDTAGWDGNWYRRAYYDDGRPIGTASGSECRIDSISQSWAVMSGGASRKKAMEAIKSAKMHLVRPQDGLVLLLNPPFDGKEGNPGYIKGYLPGVRENGGQYTHAAVWLAVAFAMQGMGDDGMQIFHMINPINHARTPIEIGIYKTEPYAVAADIYASDNITGRGGWSWYTGAAGWMYRCGIEYILGLKKQGDKLQISPCIPSGWKEASIEYKYKSAVYKIHIHNPNDKSAGVVGLTLDNQQLQGDIVALCDDGKTHIVEVTL